MKNRNYKITDEEKEYYSFIKKTAHILAPLYDTVTAGDKVVRLREKVVDFTNARSGSRILDVGT